MRRMRRSVASSSVLTGIWEAPRFVRERFVSLISFAPTEYPVFDNQIVLGLGQWRRYYSAHGVASRPRPQLSLRLARVFRGGGFWTACPFVRAVARQEAACRVCT